MSIAAKAAVSDGGLPPSLGESSEVESEAATDEVHVAPSPQRTGNAPAEAQISPPPSAEMAQPTPGFTEVLNPAFPVPKTSVIAPAKAPDRLISAADIAPYFGSGKSAEAKREFDRGNFLKARELLAGERKNKPAQYLYALALLRGGDLLNGAKALAKLGEEYPALADRCFADGGVAYEELGAWDSAAALFAKVSPQSRLYSDARLGLFRVLRKKGDWAAATETLRPIAKQPAAPWGRDVAAEALLALADLAKSRRDAEAEKAALIQLWASHPISPLAKQAERRLANKFPIEAQVMRGESLIEGHRNSKGRQLLNPLLPKLKLPDPTACRAHFAYGKALRKERQHGRAIAILQPVVDQCRDADLRPRALYVLASSRSIVDPQTGVKVYESLAREYPGHVFADDSLYYAADLRMTRGQKEEALAELRQLIDRYPKGDFGGEAYFRIFWIHRSDRNYEKAQSVLDEIETAYKELPDTYEVERARYWRARTLQATADAPKAIPILEDLVRQHPTTYYGLIARRRLQDIEPERAKEVDKAIVGSPDSDGVWPLHPGPLEKDSHFKAGIELLRLGFLDLAAAEFLAVNRIQLPLESLRLLVHVLRAAGDSRSAHSIARVSLRPELSAPITPKSRPIMEIAYPQAFRNLVDRHCKVAGVHSDLLQALMREESALDPRALSWAGARGLTQLMLPTARALAKGLKIPRVSESLLFNPELNIQLGARYLAMLMRQFKGQHEFALAGYNAGATMVQKWRAERPKLDVDEWVEEIPYSETRGYVKRVLRSFNTYQLLYPMTKNTTVSTAESKS